MAKVSAGSLLLRLVATTRVKSHVNLTNQPLRCFSSCLDVGHKQEQPLPAPNAADAPAAAQHGPGSVLQQRYAAMVSAGVLRPDEHQQQLVAQLASLLQQLQDYSGKVAQYRADRTDYEAQYQRHLGELEQLDRQKQQQNQDQHLQQQQQQQATPAAVSSSSGAGSWFQHLLGSITGSNTSAAAAATKQQLTPQQKARRAAAARKAQVTQELGAGPTPPAAPQGLYVFGSVGSGKSLLMDLFHDVARQQLALDYSRRMHFNAAMLELHSRLHHLDVQREQRQLRRRQQEEARANALAAAPAAAATAATAATPRGPQQHVSQLAAAQADTPLSPAAAGAAAAATAAGSESSGGVDGLGGGESSPYESSSVGGVDAAAGDDDDEDGGSDQQVSAWFDDAQWQQKEAKAAVLAIRKHLRASRAGRVPVAVLAAANASVMSAAARSFIRASGPDPASGWEHSSSSKGEHMAALLCFDEMQVGDVFSAAALKALLEALTAEGCVVVTTSNRHPADLPRHGLHEAMFGHFLNTLFSSCRLFELSAAADYRRLSLNTAATQLLQQPLLPAAATSTTANTNTSSSSNVADRLYFWPLGPAADAAMHQVWQQHLNSAHGSTAAGQAGFNRSSGSNVMQLSASASMHAAAEACSSSINNAIAAAIDTSSSVSHSSNSSSVVVPVMFGRTLAVPRAAAGAAWFDFEALCGRPLGSADYLAVAQHYRTLFLTGVPVLSFANRDKARRFISLVDELYNERVVLVCSAALPPDQLFSDGGGETPLLDLEGLQFEGAVEGSKLRTDLLADGGVAPVVSTTQAAVEAAALLGGAEERFAFARAVSRLYEMQSLLYRAARPRHG